MALIFCIRSHILPLSKHSLFSYETKPLNKILWHFCNQAPKIIRGILWHFFPSHYSLFEYILRTFQDRAARRTSSSSSRETLVHVKDKGKWNNSPNNSKCSLRPTDNPAHKDLSCHCWGYKATSSPIVQLATNPASSNPNRTPRSNHNTSSLHDWIVNNGCTSYMNYASLSCVICRHTTQKFLLEMDRILKLHAW